MTPQLPSLADALALAGRGWEVLPLAGKIPTTPRGVKDATTDPARIRQLWGNPNALRNMGARVPSQLVVLDFDPQNGGTPELLEQVAGIRLPPTLAVHSGRGTGGQHRYYLHPGGSLTSSQLRKRGAVGIDVKTSTGYCVVPPSLHPATGKPYTWEVRNPVELPSRLVELLRPAVAAPMPPRRDGLPPKVNGLLDAVALAPEGDRNARLYWAARRALAEGQPHEVLDELERTAAAAGLPVPEARRTIQSARRGAGAQ